jgi:hypothetical protein
VPVGDEVQTSVTGLLKPDKVANRTEKVSKMEPSRCANAGQNNLRHKLLSFYAEN